MMHGNSNIKKKHCIVSQENKYEGDSEGICNYATCVVLIAMFLKTEVFWNVILCSHMIAIFNLQLLIPYDLFFYDYSSIAFLRSFYAYQYS